MTKKLGIWIGIAFLIFFIAYRPDSAIGVFQSLGNAAEEAIGGVTDFFKALVT